MTEELTEEQRWALRELYYVWGCGRPQERGGRAVFVRAHRLRASMSTLRKLRDLGLTRLERAEERWSVYLEPAGAEQARDLGHGRWARAPRVSNEDVERDLERLRSARLSGDWMRQRAARLKEQARDHYERQAWELGLEAQNQAELYQAYAREL